MKEHLEAFNINRDSPLLITEFDIQDVQEPMSADVVSKILNNTITNIVKHLQAKDINGKRQHLGLFNTPQEAFAVYKPFKENLCKQLALKWQHEIDPRLFHAMMK